MYTLISNNDFKNNPTFITPWSLIHFLIGFVGIINSNYFNIDKEVSLIFLLLIHTLYEFKDYYFSYVYNGPEHTFSKWSSSNSIFNILGDTAIFILGMALAINVNVNKFELIMINILLLIVIIFFFTDKNLS